jgi:preprotein translocase subunit SecG
MTTALTVLHVLACFILIAVVLLQRGKGAEMGAVFGGGASSTVFGSRGAGTFLSKLTTGCAILFMLTSFLLSNLYARSASERLFEGEIEQTEQESPFEQFGTVPAEEPTGADGLPPLPAKPSPDEGDAGVDDAATEPAGDF